MTALFDEPLPAHYSDKPLDEEGDWERCMWIGWVDTTSGPFGSVGGPLLIMGDGTVKITQLDHIRSDYRYVHDDEADTWQWYTLDDLLAQNDEPS